MIGKFFAAPLAQLLAGICAALLITVGVLWWLLGNANERAAELDKALTETKTAYTTAMKAARDYAFANKTNIETHNRALKQRTDDATERNLADGRSRADRFIAANRVRCKTPQGDARTADLPGAGTTAESADGPGGNAELVAVKPADVRVCSDNSIRLRDARDWILQVR